LAAEPASIATAVRCLAGGGLVAFPTETVYGLGADATNADAVARVYVAKGRPSFNPLIAHVADIASARARGRFDDAAERLAAAFWPGPLTLVLPRMPDCDVAELATAGLDTMALRVPNHPIALAMLTELSRAVVAPSANRSGHVSPTTAAHVLADLGGRIDLIIDGGPTSIGVESAIVACLGGAPQLLRPGGLARDQIERALGRPLEQTEAPVAPADDAPLAPGMLSSHYAPRTPLRLGVKRARPGEALLAFGPALPEGAGTAAALLNLSEEGDLIEAAANLFAYLRTLDAAGAAAIAVMPIPDDGLGAAINDRLRRAAALKDCP
jgi:L-threonylcarbamoyladenylate synthase